MSVARTRAALGGHRERGRPADALARRRDQAALALQSVHSASPGLFPSCPTLPAGCPPPTRRAAFPLSVSSRGRGAGATRQGTPPGSGRRSGRSARRRARPRRPCCPGADACAPAAPAAACRSPRRAGGRDRASAGPRPRARSRRSRRTCARRAPGIVLVVHDRVVGADMRLALDLQGLGRRPEVDREAAGAGGLAADRAVAEAEGIGVRRLDAEPHGAAVAGSLEVHGATLSLLLLSSPPPPPPPPPFPLPFSLSLLSHLVPNMRSPASPRPGTM